MLKRTEDELRRCFEIVLAGEGPLLWRLRAIAPFVVNMHDPDFATARLRRQWRRVRYLMIAMGLIDDRLDERDEGIDQHDAVMIAIAFIELCQAIAGAEVRT